MAVPVLVSLIRTFIWPSARVTDLIEQEGAAADRLVGGVLESDAKVQRTVVLTQIHEMGLDPGDIAVLLGVLFRRGTGCAGSRRQDQGGEHNGAEMHGNFLRGVVY